LGQEGRGIMTLRDRSKTVIEGGPKAGMDRVSAFVVAPAAIRQGKAVS
jgi:hypothetical protein